MKEEEVKLGNVGTDKQQQDTKQDKSEGEETKDVKKVGHTDQETATQQKKVVHIKEQDEVDSSRNDSPKDNNQTKKSVNNDDEIPASKMTVVQKVPSDEDVTDGSVISTGSDKEHQKLLSQTEKDTEEIGEIGDVEACSTVIVRAITDLTEVNSQDAQSKPTTGLKLKRGTSRIVGSFREFFRDEWHAFKEESKTNFNDKPKVQTKLDFDEIRKEWKNSPENYQHWEKQKVKENEDDTCCPLFYSILIGLIFTVVPNGAIVLDLSAASEYLGGEWYLRRDNDPVELDLVCRNSTSILGGFECFEKDPIWGTLTLVLLFLPGVLWSLGIFIQFASYLRKRHPSVYDKKRRLFFFFIPLAALSMVTFPIQLMTVSIISCFNNQDHWLTLTSKIGIAEGFFNAHSQYMLQLFVFFVKADRHPSMFQYLAAFGSLLFLVWSRIESLLLDRGGHRLSPGQKAWWICRYGPIFLFNSAFKLGSISLILAMLRYNAIWLYGGIILIWLLLQFLFNEQWISKRYYFLFIGAGLHAVSIAHIDEEVKMIKTYPDAKQNILWTTKLTDLQLKINMWFQNIMWFIINSVIIITLTLVGDVNNEAGVPIFWPFIQETLTFKENKVFGARNIVTPIIITAGVISLCLLWFFDFDSETKKEINKGVKKAVKAPLAPIKRISSESISADIADCGPRSSVESRSSQDPRATPRNTEFVAEVPGFRHHLGHCPGCEQPAPAWHRYISDNVAEVRK